MKKLVSIIVPVYNKEKFIDKLLDTILNQTYKNIEVILVDDGSKDGSLKKCKSYKDKRIKVIHKENGGVSTARNVGLEAATGDYIAFVDADDYIEKDFIKKLITNIKDYDICECGYNRVDEEGNILEKFIPREELLTNNYQIQDYYLNYNNTNDFLWNKMFKKEVLKDIEFNKNYKCSEVFLYIAEVLLKTNSKITIPDALYNYVCNDQSVGNETFSPKKLDVIYARENAFDLYDNELRYMVATQIMYQSKVLYNIADDKSKEIIKKTVKKYYKYLYKTKCNLIKKLYRIFQYTIFYLKIK